MLWPNGTKTKPRVSSPYGADRGGGRKHAGVDFIGYSDVHAILPGRVTFAGHLNDAAGLTTTFDLDERINGALVTVVNMHLDAIAVKRGDRVGEGERLGKMGDTGNATGNCDHLEIRLWKDGKMTTVDPVGFIEARLNAGSGGSAPAFPLPAGHYFGPRYPLTNRRSVSGYYSHRESLRRWQQRMRDRGWKVTADGLYGKQTGDVAEAFQKEKGLTVDRLIGRETWAAAWTAPVT